MNPPDYAFRSAVFRDRRRIDQIADARPGLPVPTLTGARAVFDYRFLIHAGSARESVTWAKAVLEAEFAVTFTGQAETAGDGTPRYLLTARLESGLTLVIISRVQVPRDQDDRADAGELVAAA